jgi:hypothetical protein
VIFKNVDRLIILGVLIFSSGCLGLGPATLRGDRNDYNIALQKTNDEQLLLNLVRLKYRDTPLFLEVSNITSQFTFTTSANASATFPDTGLNIFGLGGGATVEETPVVTYSPLQGTKFIQQFLSKIPLDSIYLLYKSGWSIERVLRLCLEKLGPLENAPSASGPTPEVAPPYGEFLRAVKIFRKLQTAHTLEAYLQIKNGTPALEIQIDARAQSWEEVKQLNKLLELPSNNLNYVLLTNQKEKEKGKIYIETRSLLGIMYYLSHGIDTPMADIKEGFVTQTLDLEGKPFSWDNITGDLIKVKTKDVKQNRTAVSINYNDRWFFINPSDLNSKSTFSLLGQIFYLQAGAIEGIRPTLTIPVGR